MIIGAARPALFRPRGSREWDGSMSKFQDYIEASEGVEGWLSPESAGAWDSLLGFQERSGVEGDFLEIGVWHGKSALLSTMHSRENERCIFVDVAIREDAKKIIGNVKAQNTFFIQAKSGQILHSKVLFERGSENFRWIHIDGAHTGQQVSGDLKLADLLLGEHGVVAVDDFMNVMYPQVTASVFEFLMNNRGRLSLFLCGFNKGYLIRPLAFPNYMKHIADNLISDLKINGINEKTLCKTTYPEDMNCFGLTNSWENKEFRGPDWNKDLLLY